MDGQSLQPRSHRRPEPRTPGRRLTKDHGSHVLDHLNVLYKYRHVAISVFLLVVLGVLLRTYTTVPLYRAQARLMIELEDERTAAIAGAINTVGNNYWQDPQVYYETQYRILTGRELGRRVVHRLDLGKVAEFNGAGPAPTGINRIVSTVKDAVASPFRKAPAKLPPAPAADSDAVESAMVGALLSRVGVHPVQNSRLVDVTFVSAEPAFAARAVNALADEYVQQNLELRRPEHASRAWSGSRRNWSKQQKKVEASERAMAQYREDQNALSLEDRQNIVVARLNQLNDAATKAKTNRVQKQSLYDQVKSLGADVVGRHHSGDPAEPLHPGRQDAACGSPAREGDYAAAIWRQVSRRHEGQCQPSGRVAAAPIGARERHRSDPATTIESALAEEQTLTEALEAQKGEAMALNRKSVSYTVLEREANSNRQVYEALLLREKELQVMANSSGNNVRITDRAETPARRSCPRCGATWLGDRGRPRALAGAGVPPRHPQRHDQDARRRHRQAQDSAAGPGTESDRRRAIAAVARRSARVRRSVSIAADRVDVQQRAGGDTAVMVTSAQPLEGKTITACNLALALAIDGARVLLIDADMRRPGVQRMLGIAKGMGSRTC